MMTNQEKQEMYALGFVDCHKGKPYTPPAKRGPKANMYFLGWKDGLETIPYE